MQLKNAFTIDWSSIGYRLKVDIIITSLIRPVKCKVMPKDKREASTGQTVTKFYLESLKSA